MASTRGDARPVRRAFLRAEWDFACMATPAVIAHAPTTLAATAVGALVRLLRPTERAQALRARLAVPTGGALALAGSYAHTVVGAIGDADRRQACGTSPPIVAHAISSSLAPAVRAASVGAEGCIARIAHPPVCALAHAWRHAHPVHAAAIVADGRLTSRPSPSGLASAHARQVANAVGTTGTLRHAAQVAAPSGLASDPASEPAAVGGAQASPEGTHATVRGTVGALGGHHELEHAVEDCAAQRTRDGRGSGACQSIAASSLNGEVATRISDEEGGGLEAGAGGAGGAGVGLHN